MDASSILKLSSIEAPAERGLQRGAPPPQLLSSPLRIELQNRRSDGEVPSKNCDVLVFFWDFVKIRGVHRRHACFVHLLRLLFDIVEERSQERNPFLTTNRSMSGNDAR